MLAVLRGSTVMLYKLIIIIKQQARLSGRAEDEVICMIMLQVERFCGRPLPWIAQGEGDGGGFAAWLVGGRAGSVGAGTGEDVAAIFCLPAFAGFCCPSTASLEVFASAFLARVCLRFSTAPCISPRAHRPVFEETRVRAARVGRRREDRTMRLVGGSGVLTSHGITHLLRLAHLGVRLLSRLGRAVRATLSDSCRAGPGRPYRSLGSLGGRFGRGCSRPVGS